VTRHLRPSRVLGLQGRWKRGGAGARLQLRTTCSPNFY